MQPSRQHTAVFFASCPRGLEVLLADELHQLKASKTKPIPGGVEFTADWEACYRANLHSRIATRILWRIAQGGYTTEEDIYRLANTQNWSHLFDVNCKIRVDVVATKSPLRSINFITLRIKDALCDHFRARYNRRPDVDTKNPDVRIHAHLSQQNCSLYIDTSGTPLWQRGRRHTSVLAPLKENLAAGILQLAAWEPGIPLLDPMCGSGTFLMEAASIALKQAPGLAQKNRRFGFERLAQFDQQKWQSIKNEAMAAQLPTTPQNIFGSDHDSTAIKASKTNLQAANLGHTAKLTHSEILEIAPPTPVQPCEHKTPAGILIANPPYGERIGEAEQLASLYPKLGDLLKQRFAGWHCYFLTSDTRLPRLIGLKPDRKTPLYNGAIECRLYAFKIVSGSNRKNSSENKTL